MSKFIISGFADEIDSSTDIQFKTIKSLNISYFEPRGIDGKNIADLSEEETRALREKMDRYGVKASSVGSPVGKIDITDDFEPELEKLAHVAKTAKIIGTRNIRVFSFYIPDEKYEEYRTEVMKRLSAMAELAEKEGVILLHENEKGIYGDTPERCRDIFETVKSDNLRAVFDPANFVQCGVETYPYAFNMLREFVVYMHIKDAKGQTVVPAGSGDGHVPEIISELYKSGYEGFLSLEPHLGVFGGLAQLEKGDEMMELPESDAEKFTVAADALKKIISEVEKNG